MATCFAQVLVVKLTWTVVCAIVVDSWPEDTDAGVCARLLYIVVAAGTCLLFTPLISMSALQTSSLFCGCHAMQILQVSADDVGNATVDLHHQSPFSNQV